MSAILMKALTNVFMSSSCSPAFNRINTSIGFLHGTVQRYAHKLIQSKDSLWTEGLKRVCYLYLRVAGWRVLGEPAVAV